MQTTDVLYEDEKIDSRSPFLLWGIWLFWLFFLAQPAGDIWQMPASPQKTISAIGLAIFIGVYLWATWHRANLLARATPASEKIPFMYQWWVPVGILAGLSVLLCFVQGAWALGGFLLLFFVVLVSLILWMLFGVRR